MELGASQKDAWGALLIGHAAITRKIDKAMICAGNVSLQVYDVLLALEDAPDMRMRMSDLAEAVVFDPSSLTRLVDRLEKQGYIKRMEDPFDRRCVLASLTPAGLKARESSWPLYRELIQRYFGKFLSDSASRTVAKSLYKATESLAPRIVARRVPVDESKPS